MQRVINERAANVNASFCSIKQLGDYLKENPDVLKVVCKDNHESNIEVALIKSSSQSYHLAFYNVELVLKFGKDDDLFGDGTYTIRPNIPGVSQVYTLHGKKHNIVSHQYFCF